MVLFVMKQAVVCLHLVLRALRSVQSSEEVIADWHIWKNAPDGQSKLKCATRNFQSVHADLPSDGTSAKEVPDAQAPELDFQAQISKIQSEVEEAESQVCSPYFPNVWGIL